MIAETRLPMADVDASGLIAARWRLVWSGRSYSAVEPQTEVRVNRAFPARWTARATGPADLSRRRARGFWL
jgi:hypothetical protein